MEELKKAMANMGRACAETVTAFANLFKAVCDALTPAIKIYLAQNGRIKHLASYGKKARTRKKNFNRIQKDIKRRY